MRDRHWKTGASLPPQPPRRIAKTLKYNEAQEHLLRRLGGALVLQWDAMPDALQDLLIDQAAAVEDRVDATPEAVEAFIRSAKAMPLQSAKVDAELAGNAEVVKDVR
jgi:hypothetical protein